MFLKKSTTTIKGKTYNHYKIVESFCENGKVKHRILFTLGNLTTNRQKGFVWRYLPILNQM